MHDIKSEICALIHETINHSEGVSVFSTLQELNHVLRQFHNVTVRPSQSAKFPYVLNTTITPYYKAFLHCKCNVSDQKNKKNRTQIYIIWGTFSPIMAYGYFLVDVWRQQSVAMWQPATDYLNNLAAVQTKDNAPFLIFQVSGIYLKTWSRFSLIQGSAPTTVALRPDNDTKTRHKVFWLKYLHIEKQNKSSSQIIEITVWGKLFMLVC